MRLCSCWRRPSGHRHSHNHIARRDSCIRIPPSLAFCSRCCARNNPTLRLPFAMILGEGIWRVLDRSVRRILHYNHGQLAHAYDRVMRHGRDTPGIQPLKQVYVGPQCLLLLFRRLLGEPSERCVKNFPRGATKFGPAKIPAVSPSLMRLWVAGSSASAAFGGHTLLSRSLILAQSHDQRVQPPLWDPVTARGTLAVQCLLKSLGRAPAK